MHGSSLGYLLKEGVRNIHQNKDISFAAIGVLVACLLLVGSSVLFALNVNSVAGYFETQNEVMVFLEDSVKGEELIALDEKIKVVDNINSVTFVSRDDGLRDWMQQLGDDGTLLNWLVNDNPLQNSYRIVLTDLARMDETLEKISAISGVESVSASHDVATAVVSLKKAVSVAGSAIVIILAVVSLMIIENTVRLTVFSRRKEISIMKYVGATDAFIRLPFISEGVLLGLISATMALFILWGGYEVFARYLMESQVSWMQLVYSQIVPFKDVVVKLAVYFLGGGVTMGALGSYVFLGKYLKV